MRNRSYRRHKAYTKMWRRLKEDRNQHYNNLTCVCWTDKKAMAVFKEQPKHSQCSCCCSPRYNKWAKRKEQLTRQELKFEDIASWAE